MLASHRLSNHTLLEFTGEDALTWLHGQVTNDVLGGPSAISACWCRSTGQIEALGQLTKRDGSVQFATEQPQVVLQRVENAVIMEDVTCAQIESELWAEFDGEGMRITADRPDVPDLDPEEFNCRTLELGIPTAEEALGRLPAELGEHFIEEHISFTKGCYTGQEIIERIAARGHPNWIWRGLFLESEPPADVQIEHPDRPNVGELTRIAHGARIGWIAGARLRREVAEPGTVLTVGSAQAKVCRLPFPT